jgi:hypothetical protein
MTKKEWAQGGRNRSVTASVSPYRCDHTQVNDKEGKINREYDWVHICRYNLLEATCSCSSGPCLEGEGCAASPARRTRATTS